MSASACSPVFAPRHVRRRASRRLRAVIDGTRAWNRTGGYVVRVDAAEVSRLAVALRPAGRFVRLIRGEVLPDGRESAVILAGVIPPRPAPGGA